MITLIILGIGTLMLVASILLSPSPVTFGENAVVEQNAQGRNDGAEKNTQSQSPAGQTDVANSAVTGSESAQKPQSQTNTSGQTASDKQTGSVVVIPLTGNTSAADGSQAQTSTSSSVSGSNTASSGNTGAGSGSGQSAATSQASASSGSSATASATSATATKPKSNGAKLVFVFDDAGHNLNQLEPFLNLPFKVVIAVLPGLPHSAEAAAAARKAGKQVILHQPMQAVNLSVDPGPSAIKPDMHTYEIEEIVRKNLAEIGPVVGLNNHEGSLITATQSAIGAVLDVCQAENIFFLDSRTNAETKAPQAALERGMKIYERDIFLDNEPGRDDIIAMIKKGLAVADKKGHAIMIGHVWSDGLAAIISEMYPDLVAQGYVFTDISGLD